MQFPGVQGPRDRSRMVQQSDVRCQENLGQASGERLHSLGFTGNPEVTEPGALDWKGYFWLPKQERQSAPSSSGRNESQNPSAQASGDQLPFTLKEDDDIRNLLAPGGELGPSLCSKVKGHRKTVGIFDPTNFFVNTATRCVFTKDCMWP